MVFTLVAIINYLDFEDLLKLLVIKPFYLVACNCSYTTVCLQHQNILDCYVTDDARVHRGIVCSFSIPLSQLADSYLQRLFYCMMGNRSGSSKPKADQGVPLKPEQNGACHQESTGEKRKPTQTSDFILHGIDYLPEFEKKRERRRRKLKIPRFLRIDTSIWTNSYLRFLGKMNRSPSGTATSPEHHSDDKDENVDQQVELTEAMLQVGTLYDDENTCCLAEPVETPDCPSDIVSDEWLTYTSYPFENLVMSGGGSKGYAYVGALKVSDRWCSILFSH